MNPKRLLRLGVLLGCLISLPYSAPVRAETTYFFVSPTGQPGNPGTEESPLDLVTALSATSPARPGDTIWLRGGVYRGTFTSHLAGTEDAPITVRQYPGERATIDSAPSATDALTLRGSWTRYWGFEVMSSEPNRISNYGGTPPDLTRGAGVTAFGHHLTLINLIIHDMGLSGLGIWTGSDDTEAYGNILYATGWLGTDRSHGHGVYTQSRFGVRRLTDNLIFNQFSHGIHAYGSGVAFLNNIQLRGNISFNNGIFQPTNYERNILVGGDMGPESVLNPVAIENYTYYNADRPAGRPNTFGYNGGCTNLLMRDNYIAHWTMNTLALSGCAGEVRGNFLLGYVHESLPVLYPDNEYRHVPNGNNPPPEMRPTGTRVFVRPNRYEPGRAHIAVFNWDNLATVAVDLARADLAPGTPFEIRDAQDYFGSPVVSGTYEGGTIDIPMTTTAVSLPVGNVPPPSHTLPEFGAFVVIPTNYALPLPEPIASLTAAPATIDTGQSTLSWTTSNSAQASIDQGIGDVALEGSVEVTPTETTTYTLTVTSDSGQTATDQVTVTVQPPNVPPTVDLAVAPGPFMPPATISLSATAGDTDGTIARVEFYAGSSRIGEDTTPPYALEWTNVAAGTYVVTARAIDNRDGETESTPITVVVANIPPEVTLTVPAGPFIAPATIELTASASDEDGAVTRVAFYQGTTWLGEDTVSPYTFHWTGVAAGNYVMTARAYDNRNATTTSSPVALVVAPNVPPVVSFTTSGTLFTAPAAMDLVAVASDADGQIARVAFYQGTTRLIEDTVAPYEYRWAAVSAGTYQLSARAYDDRGAETISAPVAVVVNGLPTISLAVPPVAFVAPATIALVATAADGDGTVVRVSFYQGAILLGEDTTAPFSFPWTDVSAGTYQLTARAYDNRDAEKISAPVAVVVNAPPQVSVGVPPGPLVGPATVDLAAVASDADGTVARVAFYQGATKLGEDTAGPYTFKWLNVAAGTYQITARAYDNRGTETISAPATLVVAANVRPVVTLSTSGTLFTAPGTVDLSATASDTDGQITRVAFYQGTTKLAEGTSAPYTYRWLNAPAGTYQLTARAYDDRGGETSSTAIAVVVNVLPTVSLTVAAGPFVAPATVGLTATAADSDGSIARVSFYQGATLLGDDTTAPFSFPWSNAPAGNHQLTARAYDNRDAEKISAPVTVLVNAPPAVSVALPGGLLVGPVSVDLSATATDSDGTVARVAFYQGATKVGEDYASPYTFKWLNVAAGTYQITARAYDNRGTETISAPATLVVAANVRPVVTLSTSGTLFTAPGTVDLSATASDTDGQITRVAFYQGTTKLAEGTSAPYTYRWLNAPAGTYQLTARAYDDRGGETSSTAIAVVVNVLPTVSLTVAAGPFVAPATVGLTATAADSDGSIARVSFYQGATLLGDDTTAPFSFPWSNAPAGTHQLTARAYDNRDAEKISAPVAVLVNARPAVSVAVPGGLLVGPVAVDLSATATDSDGTVARVAFYQGATKVGEDYASPYTFKWLNVAAGTYQITARAYDNRGTETISAPATLVVAVNIRPSVSLVVPPGPFTVPVTIGLSAAASDSDGQITKVAFYLGPYPLAEDTSAPYTFQWNANAGTHQFTARAYDDRGGDSISAPIAVTILPPNVLPNVSISVSGGSFVAPAAFTLNAAASDSDGITKVEFYQGTTYLGEDALAPYALPRTDVPVGTYSFTARAYDTRGGQRTSSPLTVTVR